jgi:hypothetical protein
MSVQNFSFPYNPCVTPQTRGLGPRVFIPQEQGGPLIPQGTGFPFRRMLLLLLLQLSQSQSHIATDGQVVSQSVLISSPIWGSRPDIYYYLTVTILFLWGALSDERADLSLSESLSAVISHLS